MSGPYIYMLTLTLVLISTNPVQVVVSDWALVTEAFLHAEYVRLAAGRHDYSRLFFSYWQNEILTAQERTFDRREPAT